MLCGVMLVTKHIFATGDFRMVPRSIERFDKEVMRSFEGSIGDELCVYTLIFIRAMLTSQNERNLRLDDMIQHMPLVIYIYHC